MAAGRGEGQFSIENPRSGGRGCSHERGGARGREGLRGILGGELNIFFRGRNAHQVFVSEVNVPT